ncbi:nuclear transport factor 2 family protein [Hanstruepera marina]|uniref:nuclear transport factor 2 family protein n=1 Tax=Hanstruepera marina TaxID=2873265 RepID=UPI001CA65432|nr:nuclear transport factor 2 family protein [Hanstruepera marina]
MRKIILLIAILVSVQTISAHSPVLPSFEINPDSLRIAELDKYWEALSKTVSDGDFEGYGAAYHPDAVVIFATGPNKTSVPLAKALAGWKQGFDDTKAGKNKAGVTFRLSQRIGDDTTAHETGIFNYWTSDANGDNKQEIAVHFEMLLVKKDGKWLGVMEYQKDPATEEEWEALSK